MKKKMFGVLWSYNEYTTICSSFSFSFSLYIYALIHIQIRWNILTKIETHILKNTLIKSIAVNFIFWFKLLSTFFTSFFAFTPWVCFILISLLSCISEINKKEAISITKLLKSHRESFNYYSQVVTGEWKIFTSFNIFIVSSLNQINNYLL